MNNEDLAIDSVESIADAYKRAFSRLGISEYAFEVEGERHPVSMLLHPYVFLARLAMQAEQTSMLIFGARIFPKAFFVSNNSTPTGIIIEHFDMLSNSQLNDKNTVDALKLPIASLNDMTIGHREILLDASVVDNLDVDPELGVVRLKKHAFHIHGLFCKNNSFENGDVLPILSADLVAVNELQAMLDDPSSLFALNKAREKAEEMGILLQERQRLKEERNRAIGEVGLNV